MTLFARFRPVFLLVFIVSLLGGCSGLTRSPVDALAAYRVALAPRERDTLQLDRELPVYQIDVRLDPAEPLLTGKMTLRLPPEDKDTLPSAYYFRLYPNLTYYGGSMSVGLATVNGLGAPFTYTADDTAVRIDPPPDSVRPGEPTVLGLQWQLKPPVWENDFYHLIGFQNGVWSLPAFYPMLAVRDATAEEGWRLDISLLQGDSAYAAAALYDVTVHAPASLTVVGTGSLVASEDATPSPQPTVEADATAAPAPPAKTWRMVSGPAREVALFLSDRFGMAETIAYDVRVRSWYIQGDETTGRAAAEYAAAALRIYTDLFGPYPYAELDVVAGPLEYRGMEYPGVIEIGFQLYREHSDELELRIAHEVAHQWWYNEVGNDPVNAPWLDEGLAEFSTYFYLQKTSGPDAAEWVARQRWQAAYEVTQARDQDAVVNQPVTAFGANYETLVYAKAALFHRALMNQLGQQGYLDLLRRYLALYRFGQATPEQFRALAVELGGPEADALYQQWIEGGPAPAATPAPDLTSTLTATITFTLTPTP